MLVIKEANYGIGSSTADVTRHLQSMVNENTIDVKIGPDTMGTDPSIGDKKSLSVVYLVDGKEEQKTIDDGSMFAIYDKSASNEETNPRSQLGNATSGIYSSIVGGLSIFLHLLGVGIAYKVSTVAFGSIIGYIVTALSLVIPYFGLWAVPILIFVYRFFKTSDIQFVIA
jgi:hypothetical protein